MFNFIFNIGSDLHPILVHFPIALLVAGFLLAFARRKWNGLDETEWNVFWVGAVSCVPTVVSGVISHFPYEELPVHVAIGQHQFPAMFGTLVMLIAVVWRWRSRKKMGSDKTNEIGNSTSWLVFAVLGVIWITYVGGTGGSLTYDHGLNVRGVNPLLDSTSDSSGQADTVEHNQ